MRDSGLSASDVALISGRNNDNSFGGFGGDGAWWIIILFLFVFCGWGNNGNGFGGNGSGADMNYVLNSDFATLQRLMSDGFNSVNSGINQVNNGLCNGFFNVAESFANTNQNIMQTGFALSNAINGVQSQLASCCCGIERSIDGVNYNMAMNTNNIQNTLCNNTRDVISSQEAGTRAILDAITQNRIEDKNAQIQAQQNEINSLRLAASQAAQNAYLVDQLGTKCPVPAYLTCNPNAPLNYSIAYGNNCGCNCGNY